MKKLLAAIALALFVCLPAHAGWSSVGMVTNPNDGDVIADTGALLAVSADFTVVVFTSSNDATFEIVVRNSANSADVAKQLVRVSYYSTGGMASYRIPVALLLNQRLIVRVVGYPSYDFQASITW